MDKKIIWVIIILILAILVVGSYYYYILVPQKIAPIPLTNSNENVNVPMANNPTVNSLAEGIPNGVPTTNIPLPPINVQVTPAPQNIPKIYQVQIANFAFSPANLNIKVGDTVKWTNDDQPVHQITSANFGSSNLNTGDSYSFTFTQAGSYDYHCAIHPFMAGKIVVSQ